METTIVLFIEAKLNLLLRLENHILNAVNARTALQIHPPSLTTAEGVVALERRTSIIFSPRRLKIRFKLLVVIQNL